MFGMVGVNRINHLHSLNDKSGLSILAFFVYYYEVLNRQVRQDAEN